MKFLPVLCLSVCLSIRGQAQIGYDALPLSWADFKPARHMSAGPHSTAMIHVQTRYSWESTVQDGAVYIDFQSRVYMERDKSYVLRSFMQTAPALQKARLLRHEQGHYLIALIKNLWLQQALTRYAFSTNYKAEIRAICQQTESRAAQLNEDYDRETEHSLAEAAQQLWEQKLLDMLNTLNRNQEELPLQFQLRLRVRA